LPVIASRVEIMVIDVHGHLVVREHLPEKFYWGMAQSRIVTSLRGTTKPIPEVNEGDVDQLLANPIQVTKEENIIPYMDAAGVSKMVLLPLDFDLKLGKPQLSIERQNRDYADLARRHPDRLISLVGVDPQRGEYAYDLFQIGVKEWEMKGLKLHATTGFSPNDRCAYPLYEMAQDWELPVLIHCGSEFPPLRSSHGLSAAFLVDDVASDFPRLKIVLVHLGAGSMDPLTSPWVDASLWMASHHRNVYLDLASKQVPYASSPANFYRGLRWVMDSVPVSRLLFGSDYPYHEGTLPLKKWGAVFAQPDPKALKEAGVSFTREEIEAVLVKNAETLLAL